MNAIVPLNIAALRVSPTDNSNVVTQFKGRVANFNNMPYGAKSALTSTGDAIVQLLESSNGPLEKLVTGIHLHWELPDYFRKGVQSLGSPKVKFPQAPNRWLVIRYLSLYDTTTNTWQPPTNHSWIVESDYIALSQTKDPDPVPANAIIRPLVPVPLPVNPAFGEQPYRFMGRMMDAASWPKTAAGDQYLPDFNDEDGHPCSLNSIGFLGPGFASYYPDCCSVFGFLDRFLDSPEVYSALENITPIQFKASYQVMGWIDGGPDPLDGVGTLVTTQYQAYVDKCQQQQTPIVQTPADFFINIAQQDFKWLFRKEEIAYTCDSNGNLTSLGVPGKTICAGTLQEIVWNMLVSPGTSSFLGDPEAPTTPGIWTDNDVKVAVGNTSIEALSALLKYDNGNITTDPNLLTNYEYLLDALQLGMLNELESQNNNVIGLEEALHSNGFSREQGGLFWIVQLKPKDPSQPAQPVNTTAEITLPLSLAEELSLLNQAQKDYDMARSGLNTMRKQLFMDWFRYIKMYAGGELSPNVTLDKLTSFLSTPGAGEISSVVDKGNATGILSYQMASDKSGSVIGLNEPKGSTTSLAYTVWNIMNDFEVAMQSFPEWQIIAVPAPAFWQPTDPVAVMEGSRMEPVRRNGVSPQIAVRVSAQLLNRLTVDFNSNSFGVNSSNISGLPVINPSIPYTIDFESLVAEAAILTPMLATGIANALAAQGESGNPAVENYDAFVASTVLAQGGASGLEGGNPYSGLYNAIRQPGYIPVANPVQQVTSPQAAHFTFTNSTSDGWAPDLVGWNTQLQYPEFSVDRYDPFLPVNLIWNVTLDPIIMEGAANTYSSTNLTDYFSLNADAIDYQYNLDKLPFTSSHPGDYASSVVMNKKSTFSLTSQIDNYESNYPDDPADPALTIISDNYKNRRILAQTMSGLSVSQMLRSFIPQISVEDLTIPTSRDTVTNAVKAAALTGNMNDNWYDFAFNSQNPLTSGLFGPLRSGFMSIMGLEVVDVFGQRMTIKTQHLNADGSLQVIPAMTMAPLPGDTVNAAKIYLPPRILAPSRLWFRWLSAAHNDQVPGITTDFVEMSTHPATSPVCGWVLPNHLDDNLFFYNAGGQPIGSFGNEHKNLVYRTQASNISNPADSLTADIGPQGQPLPGINLHLANFMWYVNDRSGTGAGNGKFLADLMQAILNSDQFINPANFAQDASLAVLIGRPLAITRTVISAETAGNLLPISQSDTSKTDPWPSDINAGRYNYTDRMVNSSASLGGVQLPLRMGDLTNIDDGLIGYIIETNGTDPYDNATFYAPAATGTQANGVASPQPDTLQLTMNAEPYVLTLLMDPRAAIHATTGVLPVEELSIPADQYSNTLANLQITFVTMPVLQQQQGLTVPLPSQNGYIWSWVSPGEDAEIPLTANAVNSNTVWGYSPQTLLEGWLKLSPDPNPAPTPSPVQN